MKTWFITGASTGLGRCIAEAALGAGDNVAVASIDPENMQDYIDRYGDRVLVLDLDVSKFDQVQATFDKAVSYFGQLDVVVNNAGYMQCGAVESMEEDEVRGIFDCNFFGTFFLSKVAAGHMRPRGNGTIIQISSLAGIDTIGGESMYGASKSAVIYMSQALHAELAPFGVKVIIVEPGPMKTTMAKRARLCRNPIHAYDDILGDELTRWGTPDGTSSTGGNPEKCARAILNLADHPNPPREIVLGGFAYEILNEVLGKRLEVAKEWKAWSEGVD